MKIALNNTVLLQLFINIENGDVESNMNVFFSCYF